MSNINEKYVKDENNEYSQVVKGSSVSDVLGNNLWQRGYRITLWTNPNTTKNTIFSSQTITINVDISKYIYYLVSYMLYNVPGGMFLKSEIIIPRKFLYIRWDI